jgi:hypothetical protein
VTPCVLVGRYRIFEGACCPHLHLTFSTSVLVVTKVKPSDLVRVKSFLSSMQWRHKGQGGGGRSRWRSQCSWPRYLESHSVSYFHIKSAYSDVSNMFLEHLLSLSSELSVSAQCHENFLYPSSVIKIVRFRLVSWELSVSAQCHQNYLYLPSVIKIVFILPLSSEISVFAQCHRNCRYLPSVTKIVVSAHCHLFVSPIISSYFSRNWLRYLCCCTLVHCQIEALNCLPVFLLNTAVSGSEMIRSYCTLLDAVNNQLVAFCCVPNVRTLLRTSVSTCDLVLYCVTLTAVRWKSFVSKINFVTRILFFVERGICKTCDVPNFLTRHFIS